MTDAAFGVMSVKSEEEGKKSAAGGVIFFLSSLPTLRDKEEQMTFNQSLRSADDESLSVLFGSTIHMFEAEVM